MQPFKNNVEWCIHKDYLFTIIWRKVFQKSLESGDKNCGTVLRWDIGCSFEIIILNTISNMKNIYDIMSILKIKNVKIATVLKSYTHTHSRTVKKLWYTGDGGYWRILLFSIVLSKKKKIWVEWIVTEKENSIKRVALIF